MKLVWCNLRDNGPLQRTQVAFVIDGDESVVHLAATCLADETPELETRVSPASVEALYGLVVVTNLGRPSEREGKNLCNWGSFGEVKDRTGRTIEFDIDPPLERWIEAELREELACIRAERDVRQIREVTHRVQQKGELTGWQAEINNQRLKEALARSEAHPWPTPGRARAKWSAPLPRHDSSDTLQDVREVYTR